MIRLLLCAALLFTGIVIAVRGAAEAAPGFIAAGVVLGAIGALMLYLEARR